MYMERPYKGAIYNAWEPQILVLLKALGGAKAGPVSNPDNCTTTILSMREHKFELFPQN